jgi:hypothetical protein
MLMSRTEDRELQIELTRLQIEHEGEITQYAIALSVLVSLLITLVSVYIPLGATTGNFIYVIFPVVSDVALVYVVYYIFNQIKRNEEHYARRIEELKKKYLW